MQTQIITEAGTVIGIYDPKDEHPHLSRDSEIAKAAQEEWNTKVGEKLKEYSEKVKTATAPTPAKRSLKKVASDALPKSGAGRAAMIAVPATAALLASETNRAKLKAKYDASRDVRHYRPASPYYDDGFGKGWTPKWMGSPNATKTVTEALKDRASAPRVVYDKAKPATKKLTTAIVEDPGNLMQAGGLAVGGATAAAGAVKAARASRKAAKLKAAQDARRRQNIRDAAVVGAVAAPVALGTRLLTRKKDSDVEKGILDQVGKKLKKLADPAWQKKVSGQIADVSGDAARTATNMKSVISDAKDALIPASKRKPPRLSTPQKLAIGGAGVGGLLVGRELSGPKPYPYQQQR